MAEALVRDAAARIKFTGEDLNMVCTSLKKEFVTETWQLAHIDSAQWKQLGAPIGLVAAVRHVISCGLACESCIANNPKTGSHDYSVGTCLMDILEPALFRRVSFCLGPRGARDLALAATSVHDVVCPILIHVATHCASRIFAWCSRDEDYKDDVFVFHPACNRWCVAGFPSLPHQLHEGFLAKIGGYVYVLHDRQGSRACFNVSRVNLNTSRWESLQGHGLYFFEGCAVCNGRLFVFNGSCLVCFDPRIMEWQRIIGNESFEKVGVRTDCAVTAAGDYIYIMCGQGHGDSDLSDCFRVDSGNGIIENLPDAPSARHDCCGVAHAKVVFLLGGRARRAALACVESFDPVELRWSSCCSMPTPRTQLDVFSWGTRLFVLGGHDGNRLSSGSHGEDTYNETLAEYDVENDVWMKEKSVPFAADGGTYFCQMLCSPADYVLDPQRFPNITFDDDVLFMLAGGTQAWCFD